MREEKAFKADIHIWYYIVYMGNWVFLGNYVSIGNWKLYKQTV